MGWTVVSTEAGDATERITFMSHGCARKSSSFGYVRFNTRLLLETVVLIVIICVNLLNTNSQNYINAKNFIVTIDIYKFNDLNALSVYNRETWLFVFCQTPFSLFFCVTNGKISIEFPIVLLLLLAGQLTLRVVSKQNSTLSTFNVKRGNEEVFIMNYVT